MSLESDLVIDQSKFSPDAVTKQTTTANDKFMKLMEGEPQWYEVGAEKYRQMRWNGETPMPRPRVIDSGENITIPSREPERTIPCRVFRPESGSAKGVFLHIHGGGWVLQTEAYQDTMLKYIADHAQMTMVSVGYRLAPEHPYPQPNEDCFDAADWLVDHAHEKVHFGAPLMFVGGDSAGGHLSVVTLFHLLQSRPDFALRGLILNFGAYDLVELLPQARNFDLPLILNLPILEHYLQAYLPNSTAEQRRSMWISPFYADLSKMKLPPALFNVGTLDCLLDDSVMMCTKWQMSRHEAILKIYPGAPHNFVLFQPGITEETEKAHANIVLFIKDRSN